MKLSDGEKLILVMLAETQKKLGVKRGVDPDFVLEAIYSGNLWGLEWEYPGIFKAGGTETSVVDETARILDMWSFIEDAYKGFTKQQKEAVKEADGRRPKFMGFDGNNESEHMNAANFLIHHLGRFNTEFKSRDLNSHALGSVDQYRKMLNRWEPMRKTLANRTLTPEDIVELLRL